MTSGIPTLYTPEIAARICERLSEGETLRAICRDEGYPRESTVRKWAMEDREGFHAHYMRARELGALSMADELLEVSDNGSNDWMEKNDPENPGWVVNGEHMQRSRLRVDTRKWLLAKALPKVFGDKSSVEVSGPGGAPLVQIFLPDNARDKPRDED